MGSTSGWAKMNFLNCLRNGHHIPCLGSGSGSSWVRAFRGWFRVEVLTWLQIVTGGQSYFSTHCNNWIIDWWFYLLILHSHLNYNNFYCGYNFALLVCYNKIPIPISWHEHNHWFMTTKFIFRFIGMSVASMI